MTLRALPSSPAAWSGVLSCAAAAGAWAVPDSGFAQTVLVGVSGGLLFVSLRLGVRASGRPPLLTGWADVARRACLAGALLYCAVSVPALALQGASPLLVLAAVVGAALLTAQRVRTRVSRARYAPGYSVRAGPDWVPRTRRRKTDEGEESAWSQLIALRQHRGPDVRSHYRSVLFGELAGRYQAELGLLDTDGDDIDLVVWFSETRRVLVYLFGGHRLPGEQYPPVGTLTFRGGTNAVVLWYPLAAPAIRYGDAFVFVGGGPGEVRWVLDQVSSERRVLN
ncbi:hypothetical protein [Deinococcus soli (ex Cha et al. 2016)]|uniref:Uncharacterized protein n=2 Tax=Deinococcus soli (ex Cha et al. 2016) TaxID=1309411 RepID=A0ACC6KGN7_9DEIO|nr:hypothetical protein [Deinococcus soli (ex Cha et al. 2016)]MDR6218189.1 hypothetical protein [Deinococcus soli (ex Cha et al. 2016)]MDR6328929.1 hypothetical protein [Deinococcus soli (ex Cha et al. 2016)]MDR6751583.1 hypothetical protein [Deinococcus soli (ex Cha et al. 2016)]